MFETRDEDQNYECNLHWYGKGSPIEKMLYKQHFTLPDINFFFCAKHENVGKIESHLWFFKGFCAYIDPEYCQMIDIGTIPLRNSISKIFKRMEANPKIGGACGEIQVFEPTDKELGYPKELTGKKGKKYTKNKRNPCQRLESWVICLAQYAEYKLSHYIDKSFESVCGYVSVLPGAFSTFRWEAIKGDPLREFFRGLKSDEHTAKQANMFLAEDRVMCLEILRKYS